MSSNEQFGSAGMNFSSRVCGTPWFEDKGERLFHLGMSVSYRFSRTEDITISQRPESHLAPSIVSTPTYVAERQTFIGLEAALAIRKAPFKLVSMTKNSSPFR